jgi:Domain of unknown function (DUF1963)
MGQVLNVDHLPAMSERELIQAYVDVMMAFSATEKVAKANRLADQQSQMVQEMKARGRERPMLQELARHSNDTVRSWAQSKLKWLDNPPPPSPSPQRRPLRPEFVWQLDHSPPRAMTREEITRQLKDAVPKYCDRIVRLAFPAIGLWPQRLSADSVATGSRLGGMPLAPVGWQWPMEDDEPLVFLAQINCSDLRGLPGAEVLPLSGLLSFFAEYDGVMACRFEARTIAIHHWPNVDALMPAKPPIPPTLVPSSCPVAMRPVIDLPHPHSQAIAKLKLSEEQLSRYTTVWNAVRNHGIPAGIERNCSFSKLLGWPALVQYRDPDQFEFNHDLKKKIRLLLQVDRLRERRGTACMGPRWFALFCLAGKEVIGS